MSGYPRKGTKYRLVHVELLIPVGREMFMDLLSDFRGDNPDELVQWTQLAVDRPSMTKEEAEADWKNRHNETITIEEYDSEA